MAHSVANNYFPSQVVSDAEKLSYDYGLKIAKAIEAEWFKMIEDIIDTRLIIIIFIV